MSNFGTPAKTDSMIDPPNKIVEQFILTVSDNETPLKENTSPLNSQTPKKTLDFDNSSSSLKKEKQSLTESKDSIYHTVHRDDINTCIVYPFNPESSKPINEVKMRFQTIHPDSNPYLTINDPDANSKAIDSISPKEILNLIDHCKKIYLPKRYREIIVDKPAQVLNDKYKNKEITVINQFHAQFIRENEKQNEKMKIFQAVKTKVKEAITELEQNELMMKFYYDLMQNNKTIHCDTTNSLSNEKDISFGQIQKDIAICIRNFNEGEVESESAITTTQKTIITKGTYLYSQTQTKERYISSENMTSETESNGVRKEKVSIEQPQALTEYHENKDEDDLNSEDKEKTSKPNKKVIIHTKTEKEIIEEVTEIEVNETKTNKKTIQSHKTNSIEENDSSFNIIEDEFVVGSIEQNKPNTGSSIIIKENNIVSSIKNQVNEAITELEDNELMMKIYYGLLQKNKNITKDSSSIVTDTNTSFDNIKQNISYLNELNSKTPTSSKTNFMSKQTRKILFDVDESSELIDAQKNIKLVKKTYRLNANKEIEIEKDKGKGKGKESSEIYSSIQKQVKKEEIEDSQSMIYTITMDKPNEMNTIDQSFNKLSLEMQKLIQHNQGTNNVMPMYINTSENKLSKPGEISNLIQETDESIKSKIKNAKLKSIVKYEIYFTISTKTKRTKAVVNMGSLESILTQCDNKHKLNDLAQYKPNRRLQTIYQDDSDLSLYSNEQRNNFIKTNTNTNTNNNQLTQLRSIHYKYIELRKRAIKTFKSDENDCSIKPLNFKLSHSNSLSFGGVNYLSYIDKLYHEAMKNKTNGLRVLSCDKESPQLNIALLNKSNALLNSISNIMLHYEKTKIMHTVFADIPSIPINIQLQDNKNNLLTLISFINKRKIKKNMKILTCDEPSNPINSFLRENENLKILKSFISNKSIIKYVKCDKNDPSIGKFSSNANFEKMNKEHFINVQSQLINNLSSITNNITLQQTNNPIGKAKCDSTTIIGKINTLINSKSPNNKEINDSKENIEPSLSAMSFDPIILNSIQIAKAPYINQEVILTKEKIKEEEIITWLNQKRKIINSGVTIVIRKHRQQKTNNRFYKNYDNDNDNESNYNENEDNSNHFNKLLKKQKINIKRQVDGIVCHISTQSIKKIEKLSKVDIEKMFQFKKNIIINDDLENESHYSNMSDLNSIYINLYNQIEKIRKSSSSPKQRFFELSQSIQLFQMQKMDKIYENQSMEQQQKMKNTLILLYHLFIDILIEINQQRKRIIIKGKEYDEVIKQLKRSIRGIKNLLFNCNQKQHDNESDDQEKHEQEMIEDLNEIVNQEEDEDQGKCCIYHSNTRIDYSTDNSDLDVYTNYYSKSFVKHRNDYSYNHSESKLDDDYDTENNEDNYIENQSKDDNINNITISKWWTSIKRFSISVIPFVIASALFK